MENWLSSCSKVLEANSFEAIEYAPPPLPDDGSRTDADDSPLKEPVDDLQGAAKRIKDEHKQLTWFQASSFVD